MEARLKFESLEQDPVGSCSREAAVVGMFGEPGTQIVHFGSFEKDVAAAELVWR